MNESFLKAYEEYKPRSTPHPQEVVIDWQAVGESLGMSADDAQIKAACMCHEIFEKTAAGLKPSGSSPSEAFRQSLESAQKQALKESKEFYKRFGKLENAMKRIRSPRAASRAASKATPLIKRLGTTGMLLTAPFVALGLAELGKQIYGSISDSMKQKATLQGIKDLYPEEQWPLVEEAFNSLETVAPHIATDPLLSRSVIKNMMAMMTHAQHSDMGAPVTDLSTLGQVTEFAKARGARDSKGLLGSAAEVTKGLGSIERYLLGGLE